MLKDQFFIRLILGIISGIVLVISFWKMAGQNSSETMVQKHRLAKSLGYLFLILAMLGAVSAIYNITRIDFPNEMTGQPISSNMIIRPSSQMLIWGYPDTNQSMAISGVLGAFMSLALSIYCFLYKQSNCKWWKKVGKVLFCVIYIMLFYSATNFHYFDYHEYIVTILFAIMAYFAIQHKSYTKTIRMDISTNASDAVLQQDILESNNYCPQESQNGGSVDIQECPKKTKTKGSIVMLWSNFLKFINSPKHLIIFGLIWTIITIIMMLILACVNDGKKYSDFLPKDYEGYYLYPEYAIASSVPLYYQHYNYVDNRLGVPLLDNDYTLYGGEIETKRNGCYTAYQYFRITAYDISGKISSLSGNNKYKFVAQNEYLKTIYEDIRTKYPATEYIEDYCRYRCPSLKICVGDAIYYYYEIPNDTRMEYYVNNIYKRTNTLSSMNYLLCSGDTLYHIRMNCIDFNIFKGEWPSIIYDRDIPQIFQTAKDEYNKFNRISIIVLIILSIISLIHFVTLIVRTKKTSIEQIQNKSAHKLLSYIYIISGIEVLITLAIGIGNLLDCDIYTLWNRCDFDETLYLFLIPILEILCVKYPLAKQLQKKETEEYNELYLIPESIIRKYGDVFKSTAERKVLVLVIYYPLYYICTLPLGSIFFIYEFIATLVMGFVGATKWVKSSKTISDTITKHKTYPIDSSISDIENRLTQLKTLKDKGLISDSDFEQKKTDLLSQL